MDGQRHRLIKANLVGFGTAEVVDFLRFLDPDDLGDAIYGLALIGPDVDADEAIEDGIRKERSVNPSLQFETRQTNATQLFL